MQDIYLSQEKKDLAINTGLTLIEKNPTNISYYGMLASVYMRFSDYNNAIEIYQKLLLITPNNPTAQVALYQIFLNRNDLQNQSIYLLNIAKNEAIPLVTKKEIFYDILLNKNLVDYPFLKEIIQNCNNLYPDEQLFKVLLGDLHFNEGDYNSSLAFYENALNTGLVKDQYIYHKIIEICFQQKAYDKLITFSDMAISYFPVIPEFYYYKALGLMQIKAYQDCLFALLKGEEFVIDNMNLHSDFLSMIGDCYHYLNNDESSDNAYKSALEQNPDNVFVLNNFSYYLALRGVSLDLALDMVIKCDSLTKTNPNASFLDTYSWVLYQLKEYDLAREISEKALMINPNSVVVIEHYGDILFRLELSRQALVQWQKAYQIDKTNTTLKQKIDNSHADE
jgi:tetratricopeptide (TPR) repeat protein